LQNPNPKKKVGQICCAPTRSGIFYRSLNIAEGSGKFSKAGRKNYFTTARASVFECVAVLDILKDEGKLSDSDFEGLLKDADELSRILYSMVKNLSLFGSTT
jgi:four helix bundle protein